MEVVYLFCEATVVRVPYFGYREQLYNLLASNGGIWDEIRHSFIFERNDDAEQFCKNFQDFPCVWVEENGPERIRVYGFFGRFWEEESEITPEAGFALFDRPPRMPEKFSEDWRAKLETELRSRKYSPRTMRSYIYFNRLFCGTLGKVPEEIQPEDIKQFLASIEKDRNYCASSMNLAISGIKFFYRNIMKNDCIAEKKRPHDDGRLPQVLSKTEISLILSKEKNPKHRLLLMLAYSSGLRVSEVVALKMEHIDLARKVIYVRLGKGRKDRCTVLSEKAAKFITEYRKFYDIQTWLFPGQNPGRPLTIRSAQHIFDKAVRRVQILKDVSIHSLRHTFATHLLESGTDIRYIQSLLGHASLRTTERYTHIARRNVLNIKSPLDTIE